MKKSNLKNFATFTGKHSWQSLFLTKFQVWDPQLYQKDTLPQVLSCEFCKSFKNNYIEEHLQTAAYDFHIFLTPISCTSWTLSQQITLFILLFRYLFKFLLICVLWCPYFFSSGTSSLSWSNNWSFMTTNVSLET